MAKVAEPRTAPDLHDSSAERAIDLDQLIASARTEKTTAAEARKLPVRPGEDRWTVKELTEVKTDLVAEIERLRAHLQVSASEIDDLLRDGNDGAGRDPADVGTSNFERDHELSLANNAQQALEQATVALDHIRTGSYGICDHCGEPIGKGRLQAFPRATLCVSCKQREERR